MNLKLLAALTSISILICGIGALYAIPEFVQLYLSFGIELPFVTTLVFSTYKYWLLLLVIPVSIYFKYLKCNELTPKAKNIILFIFISMLLFSIVLLPLLVTVMYLPIFELEAANG